MGKRYSTKTIMIVPIQKKARKRPQKLSFIYVSSRENLRNNNK